MGKGSAQVIPERGTDGAALASDYTAGRAALLDKLDALISSRLAAASYVAERGTDNAALASSWTSALASALANITAARAGYLDNINNAQLLNISATILGRIDAAVSSRFAAASFPDAASYTAARAANIDNVGKSSIVSVNAATLLANDTEATLYNITTYTKMKEDSMIAPGAYTISFDMKINGVDTAYGRIYINGVAVGTEQSTTSSSYVTFTENISVKTGDLVQIYSRASITLRTVYIRNFRMCGVISYGVGAVVL
jgi:hypothetical protein